MRRSRAMSSHSGGFTILELLVTTAVLAMLTVMTLETMRVYVPRFELRQGADSAAQLINQARLTAIQRGVRTVVQADFTERTLTAFADVNGNPSDPLAESGRYLVYDPDPLVPMDRTDFLIGTLDLPGKPATGVRFGGPAGGAGGGDSVRGFTSVPESAGEEDDPDADPDPDEEEDPDESSPDTPNVLVFQPTGGTRAPGAFRLMDARGENVLETAVVSIVGRVEIRKHLLAGDSPTGVEGFFAQGNSTFDEDASAGKNIWIWY